VANVAPTGVFYGGGFGQLAAESVGVLVNVAWVFPAAWVSFMIIEKTVGNRVPARDEIEGLDVPEMGVMGYVNEDSVAVQVAGQEHLTVFGPGVPRSTKVVEREVPAGRA
jgi:ammonia channel protein AmtB